MKKYKVGICGNFDTENIITNGQTVKTINLAEMIEEKIGIENVCRLNTYEFYSNHIKFVFSYLRLIKECENVVILPARNSVKLLAPLGAAFKKKYNCKIYYAVVGAWLGTFLRGKKVLLKSIKKLDGVFPETKTLKQDLENLGITKVKLFPNFKRIKILEKEKLEYIREKPFKICFFARVMEEKGVEGLISALKNVNADGIKYYLDIYGSVDKGYRKRFDYISKDFPEYIKYCGVVDSNKTVETLKSYFMLAFPTKLFYIEGLPGSLIDSYCAGVPVLAARWKSCYDVVEENVTGITFELGNFSELEEKLNMIAQQPGIFNDMKIGCLKKAEEYNAHNVIKILLESMGE
ncbi:MAG: glycosyltransferase [Bacillota bacterium]|nr:glycosyltransferase [Bacillota bacterium]